MSKKIEVVDNWQVCPDCLYAIANDDYTGLDYHYSQEEADERMAAIQAGIAKAEGVLVATMDAGGPSWRPCQCCGDTQHGMRHECVILSHPTRQGVTVHSLEK